MGTIEAIFFDLGDTLGSAVLTPPPKHLAALNVYPYVPEVLQQLAVRPGRLGIISNTGDDGYVAMNRVLKACGLLDYFNSSLLLYSKDTGLRKDSPAVFIEAARRAGVPPEQVLFVGEDARERYFAEQAKLKVCPHPLLVADVLLGEALYFCRLTVPAHLAQQDWRGVLAESGALPLQVSQGNSVTVTAIVSQRVATQLMNRQFEVVLLGAADDPLTNNLYLLRDDRAAQSGWQSSAGQAAEFFATPAKRRMILAACDGGVLVALPGNVSVEDYHFADTYHGHNEKLIVDLGLLRPFGRGPTEQSTSFVNLDGPPAPLDPAAQTRIAAIQESSLRALVDRYSGREPLAAGNPAKIISRHIQGPDITRVVDTLAHDLQSTPGNAPVVRMHRFTHEGHDYYNVEAEWIGSAAEDQRGIVLVSAHLDSTAASTPGYVPSTGAAPGADDDGSGLAAVLAIANVVASLPQSFHTLRLVLFNAEEHGLVGSKAYARDQAASTAPIVAVFQMDMIGHNEVAPPTFQVHAGYLPSPDVQTRSLKLGDLICQLVPVVAAELPVPRVFKSISTNPQERDPAEGRSDHSAFHQHGYAACAVTEDFAFGPPYDDPTAEVNPNYHRQSDIVDHVDFAYATSIARVVAAAAWVQANPPP